MRHTPGPFHDHLGFILDARGNVLGAAYAAHRYEPPADPGVIDLGTAKLFALSDTAPHDCDVPGCPGPVNKRKLEALEELVKAAQVTAPIFDCPADISDQPCVCGWHTAMEDLIQITGRK